MVGARAKEGKGGGEREKNKYACPISLFFWETPSLANGAPDWCSIGKQIDACQLTASLYCLFRFRQSFGIGAAGNVACITQ